MGNGMWCMCLPRAHIWSLWCKTPRCQQLLWLLWFKVESRGKNSADLATRCHPQASAQKVVACWDPDWSEKHGVKWWKVEGCGTLLFFILLVEFWILSPGYHLQKTSNYDQLVCWWDQTIYIYIILHYNAVAALESHGFEFLGLPCDALRSALVGMEKQQAATFCMVRQQPDFYSNLSGLKTRMDRYTIHRSSQIHCFILFRYVTMICFDIYN